MNIQRNLPYKRTAECSGSQENFPLYCGYEIHTRSAEKYHWTGTVNIRLFERPNMFKIKHISLNKCPLDFFICPTNE